MILCGIRSVVEAHGLAAAAEGPLGGGRLQGVRDREMWERLAEARDRYTSAFPAAYDEVLYEVAARVRDRGSLGKADIGALVLWKRMQANTPWATKLSSLPDARVREITGIAFSAVRNEEIPVVEAARRGRAALSGLPGCGHGDALASALLVAAAPGRMAVYDRRADTGLTRLGITVGTAPGRYARYMHHIEHLRTIAGEHGDDTWTARAIDLALYWIGRPQQRFT